MAHPSARDKRASPAIYPDEAGRSTYRLKGRCEAHHRYYPLEISYFKSSTDSALLNLLWNKYWVNTLSSNPLLAVRALLWINACDPVQHPLT